MIIREWIYSGPFDKNVSDLYEDNYRVYWAPYQAFIQEAYEAATKLQPAEGAMATLFDQSYPWSLLRTDPSETKMTWAKFGIHARLLVTFAATRIYAPGDGIYDFRLWLSGAAAFFVNGKRVFTHEALGRVDGNFEIQLPLREGMNEVLLVLSNAHLHCMNSFTLWSCDPLLKVDVPKLLEEKARNQLEQDFSKFYMRKPMVSGDDPVTLNFDEAIRSGGTFVFHIWRSQRGVPQQFVQKQSHSFPSNFTPLPLLLASALPGAGEYVIDIHYLSTAGELVTGPKLSFTRVDRRESVLPSGGYTERKQAMLSMMAVSGNGIHRELAKMECGLWDDIDYAEMERSLAYINDRYDCADFAIHGVLRMYMRHKENERIPASIKEAMKHCILHFKYWVDEPGRSMMFTRSENHEILFYTAEYLAGLLFPAEMFPNSGQNGLFHALKGQGKAERWIKEKGTYGYSEWHSNVYYEEDLLALVNVYDFGEENSYTQLLARKLIDLTVAIMASHSFQGVMGTTHGRSYEDTIIHPELEPISHLNWLLFGQPRQLVRKLSIGCVALASSSYMPEPFWEELATSQEALCTRTRMGLFPKRGMDGVNCSTYRTKNYMVSGMVESKKGEFGGQVHAGQVLLEGNVPVFVSCFDNKSEMTRPSYWAGQYRNPKTIAYRNVLAHLYELGDGPGFTHCYFPIEQFDESFERDGWRFGRSGDAYIAVYSHKPYEVVDEGRYKHCELLCREKSNVWILEAGNREVWGGFAPFVDSFAAAVVQGEGSGVVYRSPSQGEFVLHYDKPCTVQGERICREENFPLIDNPYVYSDYGSGLVYRVQGDSKTCWLNFTI